MKKVVLVVIIINLMIGCKHADFEKHFNIKGEISGDIPEFIYLNYGVVKDSSAVINNKFDFYGKVDFPIEAEFVISPMSSVSRSFYIENTDIEVQISVKKKPYRTRKEVNFIEINKVFGTSTSLIREDFEDFENKNKLSNNWTSKLYNKLDSLIIQKPQHRYIGELVVESSLKYNLTNNQIKFLYKKIDTINQSNYTMKRIRKSLYNVSYAKMGGSIINFNLPNKEGKLVSTTKFKGKVLLIDFWASWCVPCRKQNKELKKIFATYKSKGFSVLGVSVDTNRDKWLSAINKDDLDWDNVNEINGFDSKLVGQYNLMNSIPHDYLIDKEGKIIAVDIKIPELKITLNKLLIE